MVRIALLSLLLSLAAPMAQAGTDLPDTLVQAEVLPGWRTAEGRRMVALRITLAPGWKTYWRAPGDAGIPPRFDWSGSGNLARVALHWPAPKVFDSYGLRTVGYDGALVLPMELTPRRPGAPITLNARMELGICETICVPAELHLEANLAGPGRSDPAIHAALAARPVAAARAGVGTVACTLDPARDGLRLTARIEMPRLSGTEFALVETADSAVWVSEPRAARNGGVLTVTADLVPPRGVPLAVGRDDLRFTIIGASQAVDIRGCTTR